MAYILRRWLTCMCWAQKFGILIFACFCFLLVVLCFSGPCCSCSVSTVNFCWILFLYVYSANWFYFARHMAEAETRKKCECHSSSKAVPRTIFTSHTLIFRSAWVGVWLRFVYVHLSGFNVRSSVKSPARKKRFTFQRLVSAVSCLCFTVMCGFSFLNVRGLVFINSHKARPFSKRYFLCTILIQFPLNILRLLWSKNFQMRLSLLYFRFIWTVLESICYKLPAH